MTIPDHIDPHVAADLPAYGSTMVTLKHGGQFKVKQGWSVGAKYSDTDKRLKYIQARNLLLIKSFLIFHSKPYL